MPTPFPIPSPHEGAPEQSAPDYDPSARDNLVGFFQLLLEFEANALTTAQSAGSNVADSQEGTSDAA